MLKQNLLINGLILEIILEKTKIKTICFGYSTSRLSFIMCLKKESLGIRREWFKICSNGQFEILQQSPAFMRTSRIVARLLALRNYSNFKNVLSVFIWIWRKGYLGALSLWPFMLFHGFSLFLGKNERVKEENSRKKR